jgi:hypothetical protein
MIRAGHKDSNRVAQGTLLPGVGTAAEAGLEMIVDHAAGLEGGVRGHRAGEGETVSP